MPQVIAISAEEKIFLNSLKMLGKYADKYIRHVFTHIDKQILLKRSVST